MKYLIALLLSTSACASLFIPNGSILPNKFASSAISSSGNLNLGLSASVATNAMTIALKQNDGSTNATSLMPVKINFRSSTATNGSYNIRSVTSSLSIVIPSGTSLGTVSNANEYVYVYALDNSGTVELAVSLSGGLSLGSLQNTSAISGGTSRSTLYSTSARTSVPISLIGRVKSIQTIAGTWATTPSELSLEVLDKANIFSNSSNIIRQEYFRVTSNCTSNPCTIDDQSDPSNSITWTSTGQYVINFANAFSIAPSCTGACSGASGVCFWAPQTPTTTSFPFNLFTVVPALQNGSFTIICSGKK